MKKKTEQPRFAARCANREAMPCRSCSKATSARCQRCDFPVCPKAQCALAHRVRDTKKWAPWAVHPALCLVQVGNLHKNVKEATHKHLEASSLRNEVVKNIRDAETVEERANLLAVLLDKQLQEHAALLVKRHTEKILHAAEWAANHPTARKEEAHA